MEGNMWNIGRCTNIQPLTPTTRYLNVFDLDKKSKFEYETVKKFINDKLNKIRTNGKINEDARFKETCLEHKLCNPLTPQIENGSLQLLVAVSGAGKTRRIYEYLYSNPGIFFTTKKQGNGGSADFEKCISYTIKEFSNKPDKKESYSQYFNLLFWARVMILEYMVETLKFKNPMLLLAQIHPDLVFSTDIFVEVFEDFVQKYYDPPLSIPSEVFNGKVFVDEIQASLDSECGSFIFNSEPRRVFSPLLKSLLIYFGYQNLILSGTGISFQILKEHITSSTFKSSPYTLVTNFKPMNKDQVYNYSLTILREIGKKEEEDATQIAKILSENPLVVGGRARFTVFFLDLIMRGKSVEESVLEFFSILRDTRHLNFPIRNWESKKSVIIRNETYFALIKKALINILMGKEPKIYVSDDDLAEMLNMGIGFSEKSLGESFVVLKEFAVVNALFSLYTESEIAHSFLDTFHSLNDSCAGFHFEYLVMLKYLYDYKELSFAVHRGPLYGRLDEFEKKDFVAFFPDNFAGIKNFDF
jgi:hypothetical protein